MLYIILIHKQIELPNMGQHQLLFKSYSFTALSCLVENKLIEQKQKKVFQIFTDS